MFQVTVITTITPVPAVCSGVSSITMSVTMVPTSVSIAAALGQHDVALPPPVILRDAMRGVADHVTVPQQQSQSHMCFQAYVMEPQMIISVSELTLPLIFLHGCLEQCFLSSFSKECD